MSLASLRKQFHVTVQESRNGGVRVYIVQPETIAELAEPDGFRYASQSSAESLVQHGRFRGTSNFDLSAQRNFKIMERLSMKFCFDAFNAFNTPNFADPNSAIGSPTAGVITGTLLDNRDLQASVTLTF